MRTARSNRFGLCCAYGCLLAVLCATQSGCTVWQLARRTVCYEPECYDLLPEEKRECEIYHGWAEAAWSATIGTQSVPAEFYEGFVSGFVDHVFSGGDGSPPPVPPRRFWKVEYRSDANQYEQWLHGFSQGAQAAIEGQYRDRITMPVSREVATARAGLEAMRRDGARCRGPAAANSSGTAVEGLLFDQPMRPRGHDGAATRPEETVPPQRSYESELSAPDYSMEPALENFEPAASRNLRSGSGGTEFEQQTPLIEDASPTMTEPELDFDLGSDLSQRSDSSRPQRSEVTKFGTSDREPLLAPSGVPASLPNSVSKRKARSSSYGDIVRASMNETSKPLRPVKRATMHEQATETRKTNEREWIEDADPFGDRGVQHATFLAEPTNSKRSNTMTYDQQSPDSWELADQATVADKVLRKAATHGESHLSSTAASSEPNDLHPSKAHPVYDSPPGFEPAGLSRFFASGADVEFCDEPLPTEHIEAAPILPPPLQATEEPIKGVPSDDLEWADDVRILNHVEQAGMIEFDTGHESGRN